MRQQRFDPDTESRIIDIMHGIQNLRSFTNRKHDGGFTGELYRGINLDAFPDLLSDYETEDSVITERGFMSTSQNHYAVAFHDTVLIYGADSTSKGVDLDGVSAYTASLEFEMLFFAGTKFKIVSVDKNDLKKKYGSLVSHITKRVIHTEIQHMDEEEEDHIMHGRETSLTKFWQSPNKVLEYFKSKTTEEIQGSDVDQFVILSKKHPEGKKLWKNAEFLEMFLKVCLSKGVSYPSAGARAFHNIDDEFWENESFRSNVLDLNNPSLLLDNPMDLLEFVESFQEENIQVHENWLSFLEFAVRTRLESGDQQMLDLILKNIQQLQETLKTSTNIRGRI